MRFPSPFSGAFLWVSALADSLLEGWRGRRLYPGAGIHVCSEGLPGLAGLCWGWPALGPALGVCLGVLPRLLAPLPPWPLLLGHSGGTGVLLGLISDGFAADNHQPTVGNVVLALLVSGGGAGSDPGGVLMRRPWGAPTVAATNSVASCHRGNGVARQSPNGH